MIKVRPNLHTLALGAMVLTMWYAGAAQQNGGAYILAFVTMALVGVSMMHARANLRAVQIQPGVAPPAREGEALRLPVTLTVGDGSVPCGIELTGEGVAAPVFIDSLSMERPARAELSIAQEKRGQRDEVTVLVRSHFPLGFFTAQRAITLTQKHLVLPKAKGTLPLPPAKEGTADGRRTTAAGASGEGEDFAGVREWQVGDSLRHVDWKAVARGRPMMVKLWSGAPAGVVWLEWDQLDLPTRDRVAQLAQWIEDAEARGLDYGLRLPGVTLQPDQGIDHQRRCLEALAVAGESSGEGASGAQDTTKKLAIETSETRVALPGDPMRLMLLALALTVLPMISVVPAAGVAVLYATLLWRWWRLRHDGNAESLLWRLLLVLIGLAGTYAQAKTLVGLEAGVSVMLAVTAGKVLEARTPRDLQVLALLGWFLCLCNLTLDQGVGRSLWTYAMFILIAAVLVRFRRGVRGVRAPLRLVRVLMVQALPFALLLFVFFPRGTAGMVVRLSRGLVHRSGMSNSLNPGDIANLVHNFDIAFRVTLEGKPIEDIAPVDRYWRCVVLGDCKGLRWGPKVLPDMPQRSPSAGSGVIQKIQLAPHGGHWLPALDMPTQVRSHHYDHALLRSDNVIQSSSTVDALRVYEVRSNQKVDYLPITSTYAQLQLDLPEELSPQVRELALKWKAEGSAAKIVRAGLEHIRSGGYKYTLEPGTYDPKRDLEEFWFERKQGFCDHYAAAFATLMRAAGVPARVVLGYQGGEYYARGGYLIVRQSDAHAWSEVFYDGGWHRVDPTAALAPARLSSDLRSAMEGGGEGVFEFARNSLLGRMSQEAALLWDQANYLWYDRVVQFDEMEQESLWREWGLFRMSGLRMLGMGMALLLVPFLTLWFWLRRRARHPDPGVRLWMGFCDRLGKLGARREPGEGPLAYAQRAASLLPDRAVEIERVAQAYVEHRYGAGDRLSEMRDALRP